ncbi:MAG: hypothetical protein OHK0029_20980 [Armatimonadaceae bacterium]
MRLFQWVRHSSGRASFAVSAALLLCTAAQAQNETLPVKISGVIEANYTVNFNQPANGSNTFLYNNKEGQFALNLADLRFSKDATPVSRTGFMLRLIEGEVRQRNFNLGEANPGDATELPHILEAYGTYLVPWGGKDLKVDVGQFVTHVGYETIDIGTNNFFSRNFLFQFPSPFYNAGIRASLPLGDRTTVTGVIYNRYNGTNDTGNRDLAPGFQVVQRLSNRSTLIFNGLTSRENLDYMGYSPVAGGAPFPTPNNKQQSVLDLIYTNQFSDSFSIVFEGLYRFGKNAADESYNATGGALYGIYRFKNNNVLGLRAEYLTVNKVNTPVLPTYPLAEDAGSKPSIGSITATYELQAGLFPGMRTFFEYRLDFAGKKFFPGKDLTGGENPGIADFKKTQSTLTLGQVFAF